MKIREALAYLGPWVWAAVGGVLLRGRLLVALDRPQRAADAGQNGRAQALVGASTPMARPPLRLSEKIKPTLPPSIEPQERTMVSSWHALPLRRRAAKARRRRICLAPGASRNRGLRMIERCQVGLHVTTLWPTTKNRCSYRSLRNLEI
jgi:hypothetical protein